MSWIKNADIAGYTLNDVTYCRDCFDREMQDGYV